MVRMPDSDYLSIPMPAPQDTAGAARVRALATRTVLRRVPEGEAGRVLDMLGLPVPPQLRRAEETAPAWKRPESAQQADPGHGSTIPEETLTAVGRLRGEGLTDIQISRRLNVSAERVSLARRRLRLPSVRQERSALIARVRAEFAKTGSVEDAARELGLDVPTAKKLLHGKGVIVVQTTEASA